MQHISVFQTFLLQAFLSWLQAVAGQTSTPLVVVLIHGGPLDVAWLEGSDRVDAILTSWFPGQVSISSLGTGLASGQPDTRQHLDSLFPTWQASQPASGVGANQCCCCCCSLVAEDGTTASFGALLSRMLSK